MAGDEIDEDDLDEDEVAFFKCNSCGLRVSISVAVTETVESRLSCRCGEGNDAAIRTETTTMLVEKTGYVTQDRHVFIEESEDVEQLDRTSEDETVDCEMCLNKIGCDPAAWGVVETTAEEDDDADMTITCGGCDREIEFGYSHANQQGRIFLGEDDSKFNPWMTFPEAKYRERWQRVDGCGQTDLDGTIRWIRSADRKHLPRITYHRSADRLSAPRKKVPAIKLTTSKTAGETIGCTFGGPA